jgi:hypothetical protein
MIDTFLYHTIYDLTVDALFSRVIKNFPNQNFTVTIIPGIRYSRITEIYHSPSGIGYVERYEMYDVQVIDYDMDGDFDVFVSHIICYHDDKVVWQTYDKSDFINLDAVTEIIV